MSVTLIADREWTLSISKKGIEIELRHENMLQIPSIFKTGSMLPPTKFLHVQDGETLAYIHSAGQSPGVVFLPGFMSNMRSTKSQAIFEFCHRHAIEFTTLDYYGHGESTCLAGEKRGSIGRWTDDAIQILDHISKSPKQIVVGSSMGAWIMTLLAEARLEKVDGLVGIASAPDFTSTIAETICNDISLSRQMDTNGFCDLRTDYNANGYYRIYKEFLDEASTHTILSGEGFDFDVPIRLLHGTKDKDIDFKYSQELFSKIRSPDKELILVDEGDHRLSKPEEIRVILKTLENILQK